LQLADLLEAAVLDAPERGDRRLRLPPERQIAAMFGVSRITVRAALDALALRLPLRRRVGAGVFVEPSALAVAPWSMVRLAPQAIVRPSRPPGGQAAEA
jgi:DNA-binding GntR family transcriptional regulator